MPRFVVLEHTWNGVHWDLMLEAADGSALHTWAVDAPIVPNAERPARRLADHRTAYLDHEGPVSGNRGFVRRIAAGIYRPIEWSAERVEVELTGRQLVGRLVLRAVSTGEAGEPAGWLVRLGKRD